MALGAAAAERPAAAQDAEQKKLLDQADQIAVKVARLRGLKLRRPIKRGVMTKDQIQARLLERMDQEYAPDEIASEEIAMKRLGLLPPDADYKKIVLKLLTDQVAAFYDPWDRQLYLSTATTFGLEMVMAHEIDHALQDQSFDLRKWVKNDKHEEDAGLARQAVVEGDGTALMIEYLFDGNGKPTPWAQDGVVDMLGKSAASSMVTLADVPLALREGLVFPYMSGLQFIVHFRKTQPWSSIDAVFRKPPLSTEQIMHPEKYDSYEKPVHIGAAPPAALKGYATRYDNVEGELGLSLFLRQHGVADAEAATAAAGWGGDRVAVYTAPVAAGKPAPTGQAGVDATVGVVYTVWDREADAQEFFAAATRAMPKLSAGKQTASTATSLEYRNAAGAVFAVERQKDAVLLLIGAPAAAAGDLRAQVWKGWTVRR